MGFGNFLKGIASVIPGVGSALAANEANKAEVAQRQLENQYIAARNAANQNVLGQVGIENLLRPTSTSSQYGTSGSTGTTQSAFDQFTRPEVLAAYQGMEQQIKDLLQGRLGQAQTVTEAEKAAQLRNINAAYAGAAAQARNLAGKGVAPGQVMAMASPMAAARAGGIANYMATIPEIERRRQNENVQMASQFMGQVGQGTRQSGTSTSRTNQSGWSQGGGTSTGPADVSTLLALQSPVAPQQTLQTGVNPWIVGGQGVGQAGLQMLLSGAFGGAPKSGATSATTPWTANTGQNFGPPVKYGLNAGIFGKP